MNLRGTHNFICIQCRISSSSFSLPFQLPFDISNLTEEEKKVHLERRKPKTRVKLEDDTEEVGFDAQKYLKILKKK
jgi:hypothetical protein